MARGLLATQTIARTGTVPSETAGDATNGHYFVNDADLRLFLMIRNSGVTSRTVTVITPVTVDGLTVTDQVVTLASGATKLIGPFPAAWYSNDSDGEVRVDVTHAEVMLAVLRLPSA